MGSGVNELADNEMLEMYKKNLAEQLRANRAIKQVTQQDVAEAIGASTDAVKKWESGECCPSVAAVCLLADYYCVSMDAITGRN